MKIRNYDYTRGTALVTVPDGDVTTAEIIGQTAEGETIYRDVTRTRTRAEPAASYPGSPYDRFVTFTRPAGRLNAVANNNGTYREPVSTTQVVSTFWAIMALDANAGSSRHAQFVRAQLDAVLGFDTAPSIAALSSVLVALAPALDDCLRYRVDNAGLVDAFEATRHVNDAAPPVTTDAGRVNLGDGTYYYDRVTTSAPYDADGSAFRAAVEAAVA